MIGILSRDIEMDFGRLLNQAETLIHLGLKEKNVNTMVKILRIMLDEQSMITTGLPRSKGLPNGAKEAIEWLKNHPPPDFVISKKTKTKKPKPKLPKIDLKKKIFTVRHLPKFVNDPAFLRHADEIISFLREHPQPGIVVNEDNTITYRKTKKGVIKKSA